MNEINTYTGAAKNSLKYATLQQLNFDRNYTALNLEQQIADYERKFKYTKRIEDPTTWYYIQMELEKLYKLKMNRAKMRPNNFVFRSIELKEKNHE
jgi:hypothetical protein